jgi:guanylate kinase
MITNKLSKAVVITGASVTGKTTLCRRLLVHFLVEPLPVHMTRAQRGGEIENVDAVFISEEQFKNNFTKGLYLQETLESSYFAGAYYGCPRQWVENTHLGEFSCFVCPTVKMAQRLKKELANKIFWIHLVTDPKTREERLLQRVSTEKQEDTTLRLQRGNAVVDITGHDLQIDTSNLKPWEIFFRALVSIQ